MFLVSKHSPLPTGLVKGQSRSSVSGDREPVMWRPGKLPCQASVAPLTPPRPHLPCSIFINGSVRARHPWEPEWCCLETTGQQIWVISRRERVGGEGDSLFTQGWMGSLLQGLADHPLPNPSHYSQSPGPGIRQWDPAEGPWEKRSDGQYEQGILGAFSGGTLNVLAGREGGGEGRGRMPSSHDRS